MKQLHLNSQSTFKTKVEQDSTTCIAKIMLASALERAGDVPQAITLYQEVVSLDGQGTYGSIAQKALETIKTSGPLALVEQKQPGETESRDIQPSQKRNPSVLQQFHNLSISKKQLLALLAFELLSLALVAAGASLIGKSLQDQLFNQAASELAVTELSHNAKINQTGFGFRGQADNTAIIAAALTYTNDQPLPSQIRNQVKQILQNEVKARNIEYATLVGKDLRIIVNANADRRGEVFNPNNLVQEIFTDPRQIKASAIVSRADLAKESPRSLPGFANQDALIRYTITPVRDPRSKTVIAALVSGDVANGKYPIMQQTVEAFGGGYSGVYLRKPSDEFALAANINQGKGTTSRENSSLLDTSFVAAAAAANGKLVTGRMEVDGQSYTMAAKSLPNLFKEGENGPVPIFTAKPYAILVRGTPETLLNTLLQDTWTKLAVSGLVVILLDVLLAVLLGRTIAKPIQQLQRAARKFSEGDRSSRAQVFAADEVGQLTVTFNEMADRIVASEAVLTEQYRRQQVEAKEQRQEKEHLQQEIINLLLELEGAQQGDLTVQASVTTGEMGSVADAFNVTLLSLRQLVSQVKTVANKVSDLAQASQVSMHQLSKAAVEQATETAHCRDAVKKIGESIQLVDQSAQEAAAIARRSLIVAKQGDKMVDQTVTSIENIRTAVANTDTKVRRLAKSSQEISQIVAMISGISEKTNLIAFNASLEAARAGENGQGFRVVADEVRRLALQVTRATKAIEQLVGNIQQETAEVLQAMKTGTAEVDAGTELVGKTKQTLKGLAAISYKFDKYLQAISGNTLSQTDASQQVNQTVEEVAAISRMTSTEAQEVAASMHALVEEVRTLQASVSKFRLEK